MSERKQAIMGCPGVMYFGPDPLSLCHHGALLQHRPKSQLKPGVKPSLLSSPLVPLRVLSQWGKADTHHENQICLLPSDSSLGPQTSLQPQKPLCGMDRSNVWCVAHVSSFSWSLSVCFPVCAHACGCVCVCMYVRSKGWVVYTLQKGTRLRLSGKNDLTSESPSWAVVLWGALGNISILKSGLWAARLSSSRHHLIGPTALPSFQLNKLSGWPKHENLLSSHILWEVSKSHDIWNVHSSNTQLLGKIKL